MCAHNKAAFWKSVKKANMLISCNIKKSAKYYFRDFQIFLCYRLFVCFYTTTAFFTNSVTWLILPSPFCPIWSPSLPITQNYSCTHSRDKFHTCCNILLISSAASIKSLIWAPPSFASTLSLMVMAWYSMPKHILMLRT